MNQDIPGSAGKTVATHIAQMDFLIFTVTIGSFCWTKYKRDLLKATEDVAGKAGPVGWGFCSIGSKTMKLRPNPI